MSVSNPQSQPPDPNQNIEQLDRDLNYILNGFAADNNFAEAKADLKALFGHPAFEYKDMPDYEDRYVVTADGQVYKKNRSGNGLGQARKLSVSSWGGYHALVLRAKGKAHYVFVHRAVARAFIPNPENKPQVNHIDGNTLNNHVSNLEWATQSENTSHAYRIGLAKTGKHYGGPNIRSKLTEEDVRDIRLFASKGIHYLNIAKVYPVCTKSIWSIVQRKSWKHI